MFDIARTILVNPGTQRENSQHSDDSTGFLSEQSFGGIESEEMERTCNDQDVDQYKCIQHSHETEETND